ncbi:MAG: response regulator [bacterium]
MMNIKALIVEDDLAFITLIRLALKDLALELHVTRDGNEALALLQENIFDLVITDYRLPNADGIEIIKATAKYSPNCRIILMSATKVSSLPKLDDLPLLGCIEKPFSPIQFRRLVTEAF